MDEYRLDGDEWRDSEENEDVILMDCFLAKEKEVYFALEKLTPYIQDTYNRFPNELEVYHFVLIMRGP